jgi:hypothetical protein
MKRKFARLIKKLRLHNFGGFVSKGHNEALLIG